MVPLPSPPPTSCSERQAIRPADASQLIGAGIDEGASLAVEPDGTGHVYPTVAGTGVSIVSGAALGHAKTPGPLAAQRVRVTFAGEQSLVRLPQGEVEKPVRVQDYSAGGGSITPLP